MRGAVRAGAHGPTEAVHLWDAKARTWVTTETAVAELAGKDLACWCEPDALCHGDVLLRVANNAMED